MVTLSNRQMAEYDGLLNGGKDFNASTVFILNLMKTCNNQ